MDRDRKDKDKRYNSDGEELIYIGNSLWVPISVLKPKEEAEEFYARYKRPKIYIFSIIKNILLPIICLIIFDVILKKYLIPTIENKTIVYISLILILIYLIVRLGDIAIFCVTLYQKFAKLETRTKCEMTPTCSSYCIAAIKKYGLIIGLIKTLHRLLVKCKGVEMVDEP